MLKIIIKNIPKLSFNQYNNQHWSKKKQFKDKLRWLLRAETNIKLKDAHALNFEFYFKGRKIDSTNTFHYCKIFEDGLFDEDKFNTKICTQTFKSNENKVIITAIKCK